MVRLQMLNRSLKSKVAYGGAIALQEQNPKGLKLFRFDLKTLNH